MRNGNEVTALSRHSFNSEEQVGEVGEVGEVGQVGQVGQVWVARTHFTFDPVRFKRDALPACLTSICRSRSGVALIRNSSVVANGDQNAELSLMHLRL